MQLRVVRAFKSNLEDLEERRSLHSLRSLRNLQSNQNPAANSLFAKSGILRNFNRDQSPPASFTIQIPPTSLQHEPLNIHDMSARFIDDDDIDDRNDKTRETKI